MKKEKEIFFVGIENPVELRRSILLSLKDIIENLQRYEQFKAIKHEKNKDITQLRLVMREIFSLIGRLKDKLPKTGLKPKSKPKPKELKIEPKPVPKPKLVVEKPREVTELEKLQQELSIIESKLNSLG